MPPESPAKEASATKNHFTPSPSPWPRVTTSMAHSAPKKSPATTSRSPSCSVCDAIPNLSTRPTTAIGLGYLARGLDR